LNDNIIRQIKSWLYTSLDESACQQKLSMEAHDIFLEILNEEGVKFEPEEDK